jgi:hypothetical protein
MKLMLEKGVVMPSCINVGRLFIKYKMKQDKYGLLEYLNKMMKYIKYLAL